MSDVNHARIEEALQMLYEEGIKHYRAEYQAYANRWDAIGLACADVSSHALNAASLMYSWLEDWNHHSVCAVIDWMFPQLHKMSDDSPAGDYLDTLHRVKKIIDRDSVTVFTDWDNERGQYNTAKYSVTVMLEKIES